MESWVIQLFFVLGGNFLEPLTILLENSKWTLLWVWIKAPLSRNLPLHWEGFFKISCLVAHSHLNHPCLEWWWSRPLAGVLEVLETSGLDTVDTSAKGQGSVPRLKTRNSLKTTKNNTKLYFSVFSSLQNLCRAVVPDNLSVSYFGKV